MHQDFLDLLRAFTDRSVRFLIVGAYALGVHGRPRATGDLDIWVDATPANAANIIRASRTTAAFGPITVDVLGREAFIKNKRATGRARDLGDIESLGE